jgi:cell division protein FtsQ
MARSLAAPAPKRVHAPRGDRTRGGGGQGGLASSAELLRAGTRFLARHRWLHIALLAFAMAAPVLGGAWLWFRGSGFVSVQTVQIAGVSGADAAVVEGDLTQAARSMSTLEVNVGALRAAVAPLHVVRELRASSSFPHTLRIDVVEQLPVASLTASGVHTAVAANGVVLGPALASASLPSVSVASVPPPGRRVNGANVLSELAVLGAAPAALAGHVERVFTGAKGLTVAMRNGLLVYFGDDSQALAKWLSLARVLADSTSAGASYIDVRLPSHPAAGFPSGVTPPDAAALSNGSDEQAANTESAVAALADALPGGDSGAPATEPEPSSETSASSTQPAEAATAGSGATSETATTETQGLQAESPNG